MTLNDFIADLIRFRDMREGNGALEVVDYIHTPVEVRATMSFILIIPEPHA